MLHGNCRLPGHHDSSSAPKGHIVHTRKGCNPNHEVPHPVRIPSVWCDPRMPRLSSASVSRFRHIPQLANPPGEPLHPTPVWSCKGCSSFPASSPNRHHPTGVSEASPIPHASGCRHGLYRTAAANAVSVLSHSLPPSPTASLPTRRSSIRCSSPSWTTGFRYWIPPLSIYPRFSLSSDGSGRYVGTSYCYNRLPTG